MGQPNEDYVEKRKSSRVSVEIRAKIIVKMIGSSLDYEYHTINISENGLLLKSSTKKIHFNKASILEVRLRPEDHPRFFSLPSLSEV